MYAAPVVIPTLNRYEHLKKCIESLKEAKGASETELYISVDYPPAKKYEDGYLQVLKYVEELSKTSQGFKAINIYIQKENLGPFANAKFIQEKALEGYENYIFTEDDNVFSKNFLEYINFYLEKYKDAKDILAVCGYGYPINWDKTSDIKLSNVKFAAWGYGIWKEKRAEYLNFNKENVCNYISSFKNAYRMYRYNKNSFVNAVYIATNRHYIALNEENELRDLDIVYGLYMYMTKRYVVMPVISKVQNLGHDGSGVNCKDVKTLHRNTSDEYDYLNQEVDKELDFNRDSKEAIISKAEVTSLDRYFPVGLKSVLKAWIMWIVNIKLKIGKKRQ